MKTIYCIRHGTALHNELYKYIGNRAFTEFKDTHLTTKGYNESINLGDTWNKINDIDLIELNEAFSSQSLAVIRELNLNHEIINVNGGAIALGHPLGCSGAKLSVQLFNEMKERKSKYGMVTMCVGTGQGAAGIYEFLN